jgi:16S rRNA A1518/A1519 N6-dimethyltransferase RsmA/KsgA/DIM1 with predicted DNA glycosylase/AP lyase activity
MMLLEKRLKMDTITVMVQKEVARRLCALPGTADYGAITLAVRYYTGRKFSSRSRPAVLRRAPRWIRRL